MQDLFDLSGKVAIVTGAAPQRPGVGSGSAVAILFAREGAKVLLVSNSAKSAGSPSRSGPREAAGM